MTDTAQLGMQMTILPSAFAELKSRDAVPLRCCECQNTFVASKNMVQSVLAHGAKRRLEFCSRACASKAQRRNNNIVCEQCGRSCYKAPSAIRCSSRHFCSQSCAAQYRNKHSPNRHNRSYAEGALVVLIKNDFPEATPRTNVRTLLPSGLEIDIVLDNCRCGVEINGPIHFYPIHGTDLLTRVLKRDAQKANEMRQLGYQLFVINVANAKTRRATDKILLESYQTHIRPAILRAGRII